MSAENLYYTHHQDYAFHMMKDIQNDSLKSGYIDIN